MKHIFAATGGDIASEYPFKANISFQNSTEGWCINGIIYKEIADWTEHMRQTMLLSGISDYQTKTLEPTSNNQKDATTVQFQFNNPIDCFHFRALTEGNVDVEYPIHVSAGSLMASETRYKNIRKFGMENDVGLIMSPIFNNQFIINPAKLYDLVAVLRFINSGDADTPLPYMESSLPTAQSATPPPHLAPTPR